MGLATHAPSPHCSPLLLRAYNYDPKFVKGSFEEGLPETGEVAEEGDDGAAATEGPAPAREAEAAEKPAAAVTTKGVNKAGRVKAGAEVEVPKAARAGRVKKASPAGKKANGPPAAVVEGVVAAGVKGASKRQAVQPAGEAPREKRQRQGDDGSGRQTGGDACREPEAKQVKATRQRGRPRGSAGAGRGEGKKLRRGGAETAGGSSRAAADGDAEGLPPVDGDNEFWVERIISYT